MTVITIPHRYGVRGGTAANLTTVNEVPRGRELVYETDTGLHKLGDGVTAWNDLPYLPRAILTQTITNGDTTHAPSGDAVFDALAGKQATIADTGWLAPTLENSWANFGAGYSVAAYRKIGSRVILRGMIKDGTVTDGTTIFTLPAGYRPPGLERFRPSSSIASAERIVISTSGAVQIFGVAVGSNLGVSGIDFFVD